MIKGLATIAYKCENMLFVGEKDKKSEEIIEFIPYTNIDCSKLTVDRIYVAMLDEIDNFILFILDEYAFPLDNKEKMTTITVDKDQLLSFSNLVLKDFKLKTTYH